MSKAVRSRPFSPIDASWLNNEVPVSTTLIAGLILFDDVTDFDRLAGQIEDRLLRYDRFRQRVRRRALPFTLPVWEPDPDFALDAHFHRTVLPEPGGWLQLKAFIESLLAWPLPHDRPQWQMHFIEHYGTGSALVLCFSHIIADGFASMHLLNAITDAGPDDPAPPPTPEKEPAGLAGLLAAALDAAGAALRLPGNVLHDPAGAVRQANHGLQMAEALARYVLMWPDKRTLLRSQSSHAKRVGAAEPIPLSEVKDVGKAFGATVNDVLAGAIAGAFRRYLAGRGAPVDGCTLHAVMPFNVRTPERSGELGNGFSIVFLTLPVGIADPVERLRAVKDSADFIKSHPEADMSFLVMSSLGFVPAPLARLANLFFINKVTAVLTNVPGLPEPRYLAGRRIDRVMFWVPTPLMLTMGVSILSYAGRVTVCFNSDAQAVPDIEVLARDFQAEYAELLSRAGLASMPVAAPQVAEPAPAQPPYNAAEGGEVIGAPFAEFAPLPERCRCQAVAKSGSPCRNYALPGSDYCRRHASMAMPPKS